MIRAVFGIDLKGMTHTQSDLHWYRGFLPVSILLSPPSGFFSSLGSGSPGGAPSRLGGGGLRAALSWSGGAALGASGPSAFLGWVPLWGSWPGGAFSLPPLGVPFVVPPGGPPSGVWGGRRFK